ncbi:MAG: hypothetical protein ACFFBD_28920 [Candidatus Hodarchaeota archaeon]
MIKKVLPFFLLLVVLLAYGTQNYTSTNSVGLDHTLETSKRRLAGKVAITQWKIEFKDGDNYKAISNYLDPETETSRIHNGTDFRFQVTISNYIDNTTITLAAFTVFFYNITPLVELELQKPFKSETPTKIDLQPYESKTAVFEEKVYFRTYNTYLINYNVTYKMPDLNGVWLPRNISFGVDPEVPTLPEIFIWMAGGCIGVILFMVVLGVMGGRRKERELQKISQETNL